MLGTGTVESKVMEYFVQILKARGFLQDPLAALKLVSTAAVTVVVPARKPAQFT